MVECVVGEGLKVVAVSFHAHIPERMESCYDLIAGVIEDPVTGAQVIQSAILLTLLKERIRPTESCDTLPISASPGPEPA